MRFFGREKYTCGLAQTIIYCLNQPAYIRNDKEILFSNIKVKSRCKYITVGKISNNLFQPHKITVALR
jgi:hypothetical protein